MRPVRWVGPSKRELLEMPAEVQAEFGYALYLAQEGDKHENAKPLNGFGGAGVLEVVERGVGGTYRGVYTVRFEEAVYVLHCFQKKSTTGIATPRQNLELIRARLRRAESEHQEWKKQKKSK